MKRFFIPLFLFSAFYLSAQPVWQQLEQPSIRLRYLVPKGWYVGGYKSADKCHCTGAVVNTSSDGQLNMVIFYSDQQTADSLARQSVWGYHFANDNPLKGRGLEATNLGFTPQFSVWQEDPKIRVVQFRAQQANQAYLVYFWGDNAVMETQTANMERIVRSMEHYVP